MNLTVFAKGNLALRNKEYEAAISFYIEAQRANPALAHILSKNLDFARSRLGMPLSAINIGTSDSVDIVVPVYNALEDVQKCLKSLKEYTDGLEVKVIVVNDGSNELTTKWLQDFCHTDPIYTLIEHPTNFGYTKAVNTGLRASTAAYVVTQNSDTIVAPGWLKGLIRCMKSSPKLGVVGPLSNAASWQNVPDLYDQQGAFAVNELPLAYSVESMAEIIARASVRAYPRSPFVNGFCFMIKRGVINSIGYMDEENFPIGYGEENDYCIRAADAGFELAIADDVYVFHSKSKSFGHDRRKELSKQGTESLKRKHTAAKYFSRVEEVKKTASLDDVRARVRKMLLSNPDSAEEISFMDMRVLFLLPVKGGGGGAHSVVQEVTEMRRLGINVHVGVKHEQIAGFLQNYQDIPNVQDVFIGFDDASLTDTAEGYDVVVGTIWSSMELVKRIIEINPHILPAYYVQDYEPLFYERGSAKWQVAYDSYTLVPEAYLFAKTQWIIEKVGHEHGVLVNKVAPSIDHVVYKPMARPNDGKLYLAAMIRPQTPRRGAERTMRVLSRLHQTNNGKLEIHLFGCSEDSIEFQALLRNFPYINHGPLKRPEVAALLARSDFFLDLSDYQAFGRTGLEAMACGCAAVVPKNGGADEYAVNNKNSLVVDTLDENNCYDVIQSAITERGKLRELQSNGLLTASRYSVHSAAISECVPLADALAKHRTNHPKFNKRALVIISSQRSDEVLAGSDYVRAYMPYRITEILKRWKVKLLDQVLPKPGTAYAALIQRDAAFCSIQQLQNWHIEWKQASGKLIYEIDDDLLDSAGLIKRGYQANPKPLRDKVIFLATAADVVTVSTESLAQLMRQFNPNVHVIPNALDANLWQLNKHRDHISGPFARSSKGAVKIGYIGTPTHDQDLEIISAAMQEIQKKFAGRVEIEVIGGFQKKTATFGMRVGLPKKNDYPNFVRWLQERVHWDIGVIPLSDDGFNRSKSALKFLEYAALDMAIVVSDVSTYSDVAQDEVNCLVSKNTTKSWVAKISSLIEDAELRNRLAINARSYVEKNHVLENVASKLETVLRLIECSNDQNVT